LQDLIGVTEITGSLCATTDPLAPRVVHLMLQGLPIGVLTSIELERLRSAIEDALTDLASMISDLEAVREVLG
jgi:hypothetical protein